tara:strand:+ start:263 stop:817 length:555 start_codon:yes stop_codon:yes gene_type:complete
MANLDAPFGLSPIGKIGGGTDPAMNSYTAFANYATLISQGDIVKVDEAEGDVQMFAAGDGGTDATNAIGVFWGSSFTDSNGKPTFKNTRPASQLAEVFVYDDPYQMFEVQGDGASAQTDVTKHADISVVAGSSITGVSKSELDSSDIGTGNNLRIVGFSKKEGRDEVGSANIVYNVTITEHKYK